MGVVSVVVNEPVHRDLASNTLGVQVAPHDVPWLTAAMTELFTESKRGGRPLAVL